MTLFTTRFTLGFLFRTITCVAMLLAWGTAVASASPDALGWTMAAIGVVLGLVAGFRRTGTALSRLLTAVGFVLGSVIIAGYSTFLAIWYQNVPPLDEFDSTINALALSLFSPIVLAVLVFLLRAWTWSAHDAQMRRERHSTCDAKEQSV